VRYRCSRVHVFASEIRRSWEGHKEEKDRPAFMIIVLLFGRCSERKHIRFLLNIQEHCIFALSVSISELEFIEFALGKVFMDICGQQLERLRDLLHEKVWFAAFGSHSISLIGLFQETMNSVKRNLPVLSQHLPHPRR